MDAGLTARIGIWRSSESYGRVERGGDRLAHVQAEPSFARAAQDILRQIRVLLVLGGVLLLAGQALVVSSFVPMTRGGTVTIPAGPNWFYAFEFNALGPARIDRSSPRWAAASSTSASSRRRSTASTRSSDSGTPCSRRQSRPARSTSVVPTSGIWYLVLDHGQGLEESIQDVRVAFRLAGVNPDLLLYGGAFTTIGAVLVLLDRRQKGKSF